MVNIKEMEFEEVTAEVIETDAVETALVPVVTLSVEVTPGNVVENFDLYRAYVEAKVSPYKDLELANASVKELKDARAFLNSLHKQINDERLKWQRLYMAPFDDYKRKADELQGIAKVEADRLGVIIKEAEEWGRNDRRQLFEKYYTDNYGLLAAVVPFERILDDRWLNKTHKENPERAIDEIANNTADAWESLKKLNLANYEQAEIVFFRTLDLGQAIAENDRIIADQKRIEEMKRQIEANREPEPTPAAVAPETVTTVGATPAPTSASIGLTQPLEEHERFEIEVVCPRHIAVEVCKSLDAGGYDVKLRRVK